MTAEVRPCLQRGGAPATCKLLPNSRVFEQRDPVELPARDVLADGRRGMLVPAADLGLRPSQRRAFRFDAYNGGCLGVQGCVADADAAGYMCSGAAERRPSSQLDKAYAFLNAPLAPEGFDRQIPPYLVRSPVHGPNSILGLSSQGGKRWNQDLAAKGVLAQDCA